MVNPLGYLKHILLAFAQVFIFNRIKLLGQLVGLQLQRPFGIDGLRAQDINRLAGKRNVGQKHQVQRNKRAQFGWRIFRNGAAQLLQLAARGLDGGIETFDFRINFFLRQIQLRHFLHAAHHQMCPPDGNPAACCKSVQHHAHVYSPSSK